VKNFVHFEVPITQTVSTFNTFFPFRQKYSQVVGVFHPSISDNMQVQGVSKRALQLEQLFTLGSATCFKKSFTTLKAYTNLFRGHVQCFDLSQYSKTHPVLPGIVTVQCDTLVMQGVSKRNLHWYRNILRWWGGFHPSTQRHYWLRTRNRTQTPKIKKYSRHYGVFRRPKSTIFPQCETIS
jgi:hypothetical protein